MSVVRKSKKECLSGVKSMWSVIPLTSALSTPNVKSSRVGVTQPLVLRVHYLIDGIVVHNAIRRDRRRELRKDSLTEQVADKRLRTFMRGGAPFGQAGSTTKLLTTATEPPVNDQKLAGLAFCQSYQSLSIIWGGKCQKIGPLASIPLTEWCSINRGSIETSEFYIPGYGHQLETHHWGTI